METRITDSLASFDVFPGAAASTRERGNLSGRSIRAQLSVCIYLEKLSVFNACRERKKVILLMSSKVPWKTMTVSLFP